MTKYSTKKLSCNNITVKLEQNLNCFIQNHYYYTLVEIINDYCLEPDNKKVTISKLKKILKNRELDVQ